MDAERELSAAELLPRHELPARARNGSAKGQVKVLKGTGKSALASMNATLSLLERSLSDSTDPGLLTVQVGLQAAAFASTVSEAGSTSSGLVMSAGVFALEDFADGSSLDGVYPVGFYSGSRGVADADLAQAQLLAVVRKLEAQALKRIAKTAKLAEQKAGIGLTAVLRLPASPADIALSQGSLASAALGARIAFAVAGSKLGVGGDGVIVVGGFTANPFATVVCSALGMQSDSKSVDADGNGRFSATLTDNRTGLAEGNYVVATTQDGSPFLSSIGIGVR